MLLLLLQECHARLSERELQYAKDYFLLYGKHQQENCLQYLPAGYKELVKQGPSSVGRDMMPAPNLQEHVFCRVLSDKGTVELSDDG